MVEHLLSKRMFSIQTKQKTIQKEVKNVIKIMLLDFWCVCTRPTWKRVLHCVLKYVLRLYKYFNYKSHAFGSIWFLNVIVRCADRLWGWGWGTHDFLPPPPPPARPLPRPIKILTSCSILTHFLLHPRVEGGGDRVTTRCFHLFLSLDFLLFCFKSPSPCVLAFPSFDGLEGSYLGLNW